MITIREKTIDEKIADIENSYAPRFEALQVRLNNVVLSDGINKDAKIVILQDEYKDLSEQKDLELLEIFGGM